MLIDTEESGGLIEFFNNSAVVDTMSIPATADNAVQTLDWSGFDFDQLRVNLAGSGAIGDVNIVPEPAGPAALALGIGAMIRRRRK